MVAWKDAFGGKSTDVSQSSRRCLSRAAALATMAQPSMKRLLLLHSRPVKEVECGSCTWKRPRRDQNESGPGRIGEAGGRGHSLPLGQRGEEGADRKLRTVSEVCAAMHQLMARAPSGSMSLYLHGSLQPPPCAWKSSIPKIHGHSYPAKYPPSPRCVARALHSAFNPSQSPTDRGLWRQAAVSAVHPKLDGRYWHRSRPKNGSRADSDGEEEEGAAPHVERPERAEPG